MNKKVNKLLALTLWGILAVISSCKSIIEEDISDKRVTVNSPNTGSYSNYNQLFWWEKVEGALKYQLQVASPSFNDMQQLMFDTISASNKVTLTLPSGSYEWRVRAVNGSYQTPYNGKFFTVTDADLNTQTVVLKGPLTGTMVNKLELTWNPLPIQGISYKIQVSKSGTFTPLIANEETPLTQFYPQLTDETTYYWRVKAFKGSDTSYWSAVSSFVYDVTAPNQVTLTKPENTTTVLVPTTGSLTWTNAEAGAKYNVYISYGTKPEQKATVNTNSYTYTAEQNQTVKWRIEPFDAAGNVGTITEYWTFRTGTSASRLSQQ